MGKAALGQPFFILQNYSLLTLMDSLTAFVQLFSLADANATGRITERLALVLKDHSAYRVEYNDELAERGIVGALPAQELRDVALIDALLSEELLWEADWNDPVADLVYGLNETLTQQARPERLAEPVAGRHATTGPEALDILQDMLEPLGFALVLLTLDSDSYALSMVADAQAEEARQLAKELGFGITVY